MSKFGVGKKPQSTLPSVKGRWPVEYTSWLQWEVGIPIASPAVLFLILWVLFAVGKNVEAPAARALISVSGTGDLLIFSALLLINAGAKFRILDLPKRSRRDFESGDLNPDTLFWWAFMILFIYIGVRVALDVQQVDNTIRFLYGVVSLVFLTFVVLWIDGLVLSVHTKQIRNRLDTGLIESQYNQ